MTRHPSRPSRAAIAAVAAAAVLAGCGSSGTGRPDAMDAAVQAQLRTDVRTVSAALAAHHPRQARAALAKLTADTSAAHTAGTLSDTAFTSIRAAAMQLRIDLNRSIPTRTPTAAVTVPAQQGKPSKRRGGGGDGGGGDGGDGGD